MIGDEGHTRRRLPFVLQYRMTEFTLALPFALPPPELAPDLVRALKGKSVV